MTKRHLYYCAISAKEGYEISPQLGKINNGPSIYIKNAIVSVHTAMIHSGARGAIVATFECPDQFIDVVKRLDIEWHRIEFDKFLLPSQFKWSLAFFKLCALDYVSNLNEIDSSTLLDTDTIVVGSLADLEAESEHSILVYEVDHALSHPHRVEIQSNYEKLNIDDSSLVHIGGEVVSGPSHLLRQLVDECERVFYKMNLQANNMDKTLGDEFILSIALNKMKYLRANPYLFRYWTSPSFYLVSTNWFYNPVSIWHLPTEKSKGMIVVFDYIRSGCRIPSKDQLSKIMHLPKRQPGIKYWLSFGFRKIISRIGLN